MNQIPNIEEIRACLTYEIPTNNGNALVAEPSPITIQKVQDLLHHQLQKARENAQAEYKQFVLNILDGIDIADGRCNTKAIRFALESRIIHSELDQDKK